jgi:hypothetical protein
MKSRLVILALCATLAACGGGGGSSYTPSGPSGGQTATPAPTPTPTPTPTPAPVPQASQTSVTFASGSAQNVSITESGYTGTFTESDTCNPLSGAIASVAAQSNANGAATYAITPLAAGTCNVTISDTSGRGTTISVSVASAAITIH